MHLVPEGRLEIEVTGNCGTHKQYQQVSTFLRKCGGILPLGDTGGDLAEFLRHQGYPVGQLFTAGIFKIMLVMKCLNCCKHGPVAGGRELRFTFDTNDERTGIPSLLKRMGELSISFTDLNTRQSSLEDIFVNLVSERQ